MLSLFWSRLGLEGHCIRLDLTLGGYCLGPISMPHPHHLRIAAFCPYMPAAILLEARCCVTGHIKHTFETDAVSDVMLFVCP